MNERRTIVLVLKNGRGFSFRDVKLIVSHILGKWEAAEKPRIICLWDRATEPYDLGNFEILPLRNPWRGTWSRMQLYSPEMEQYRPFLYVDLDTAIIQTLEHIFDLVKDPAQFITLEDFYQKHKLATGLVWMPANSKKVAHVWKMWGRKQVQSKRMDFFLRRVISPDTYWQKLTDTIHDFKPSRKPWMVNIPGGVNLVCFHGKPRIYDAADSVDWVRKYIEERPALTTKKKVTVIIPYKEDRGWLQDAVNSVPKDVQLILSQGNGNWPQNFNKVLDQAEGDYIKYLHEDDMLTENCIRDSVQALEEQGVDFIHGNAVEIFEGSSKRLKKRPKVPIPTKQDLLAKNVIHSPTVMYRREVFDRVGTFDESLIMCEEYEFHLRCLHKGLQIGYSPNFLAYYRRHPAQSIKTTPKAQHIKERTMVKHKYL